MNNDDTQKHTELGRDFLTYLCYKSDSQAGKFTRQGAGGVPFSLWLDGKIVLENDNDVPPNVASHSGDDFSSDVLKSALRSGKKVREARFRIEQAENTWIFTLRGDRFDISGLKCDLPPVDDRDQQFITRIISTEALNDLLDSLYEAFLQDIQGPSWKRTGYSAFQSWLNTP